MITKELKGIAVIDGKITKTVISVSYDSALAEEDKPYLFIKYGDKAEHTISLLTWELNTLLKLLDEKEQRGSVLFAEVDGLLTMSLLNRGNITVLTFNDDIPVDNCAIMGSVSYERFLAGYSTLYDTIVDTLKDEEAIKVTLELKY